MKLIAFNGYKRSGKDTAATFLEELLSEHGSVQKVAFANSMKVAAAKILGYDDLSDAEAIRLLDEAKERWHIDLFDVGRHLGDLSGREYIQNVGEVFRETAGADFWINKILPKVPATMISEKAVSNLLYQKYPDKDYVIVTDLRFPAEAVRVKQLGGQIWRVNRPGCEPSAHSSEQPLDRRFLDVEVGNAGDLDGLRAVVEIGATDTGLLSS